MVDVVNGCISDVPNVQYTPYTGKVSQSKTFAKTQILQFLPERTFVNCCMINPDV